MRPALAALLLILSSAAAAAGFNAGVLDPAAPHAAEVQRLGFEAAAEAPAGAAVESAGKERMADHAKLRFLLWRAVAQGASGIWFQLPGGNLLGYPEEWQALARLARELRAARPIIDGGAAGPTPFPAPPGVFVRSWTRYGRRYVLLVNASAAPAPLPADLLEPWRAMFAVRADARQLLPTCGRALCLPPEGVLWLEGRLGSGVPR